MLEPVKCPKCRKISYVTRLFPSGYSTRVICSHFSEVITEYERVKEHTRKYFAALKRLNEEIEKEDCKEIQGLVFGASGELLYQDDEDSPFVNSVPVPFNCRCSSISIGVKSLGYSVVPHVNTSGVKGFMYGFK